MGYISVNKNAYLSTCLEVLLHVNQDQERQLAALMMIQDCAGVGAASLLSSAGAQGSSNLIYILKSLQVRACCSVSIQGTL